MTMDENHIDIRSNALDEGKKIVIDYIQNNFWLSGQYIITEEEMKQMKDELELGRDIK